MSEWKPSWMWDSARKVLEFIGNGIVWALAIFLVLVALGGVLIVLQSPGFKSFANDVAKEWNEAQAEQQNKARPTAAVDQSAKTQATQQVASNALASPPDDANALSKTILEHLVKDSVDTSEQQWCMNPLKLKDASTNQTVTLSGGAASYNEQAASEDFPIIFAEEYFIPWNEQDNYVMALLIGGQFIAVHNGGYPQSKNEPGTPGDVYTPKDLDDVKAVIDAIAERGAIVDLTDKGRNAGVWDINNGFCMTGNWALNNVEDWTPPAVDAQGNLVSHIRAQIAFVPTHLGQAGGGFDTLDPMGILKTKEVNFSAVKYSDGWRLVEDAQPQQVANTPGNSQSSSTDDGADGALAGELLMHSLSKGSSDSESGQENNDDDNSSSSDGDAGGGDGGGGGDD